VGHGRRDGAAKIYASRVAPCCFGARRRHPAGKTFLGANGSGKRSPLEQQQQQQQQQADDDEVSVRRL
jgi:hypothetical protein